MFGAYLVAQTVKNPPAMRQTWVPSLGWEDPLEEGMATHSNILAWRIAIDRGLWRATVHGVAKSQKWPSMPSNHLMLCHPLLLPSIFPSIKVFSNESVLHIRWPKYWSFSFSISPSNEYSGLIFFRMDWLDLLAVQGTLKSLLQHHSSKASIQGCILSPCFCRLLTLHYLSLKWGCCLTGLLLGMRVSEIGSVSQE